MSEPSDPFLDTATIEELARAHIPSPYRLIKVRLDHDRHVGGLVIRIEYNAPADESDLLTTDDVQRYQAWTQPLIAKIRDQWPRDVAISFHQTISEP